MGVPKRRVSHARQGERRSHHAIATPQLEECPHCHQQKRAHHACENCGWYNGREAVHIKQKAKPDSAA
jgi:large subunit ribosomal protein L32